MGKAIVQWFDNEDNWKHLIGKRIYIQNKQDCVYTGLLSEVINNGIRKAVVLSNLMVIKDIGVILRDRPEVRRMFSTYRIKAYRFTDETDQLTFNLNDAINELGVQR